MVKNIDGISMPERRKSIRNIPIPENRRRLELDGVKKVKTRRIKEEDEEEVVVERETVEVPPRPRRSSGLSKKKLWLGLIAALVVIAFVILSLFSGATLSYTPRSAELKFVNEVYSASKSAGNGLMFSVVKLSGDKSAVLPATGEQEVSRKASGTIVIYNTASEVQKFVETTRFESNDGKIYRINKAVTIPAKSANGPGSVEAVVLADQPGENYNIGLSDFTVPGLKGTARYATVYARSKTPMTGGFVGKEKIVSAEELAKAKTTLEESLRQELIGKAQGEVPGDFILFPSLTAVTFEDLPQSAATNNSVTINLRGNLIGFMFKRTELSLALATGKASLGPRDELEIDSLDALKLEFTNGAPIDLLGATKIEFKVNGEGRLLWRTDEVALKAAVAGHKKGELSQIIKNYPTITSAKVTLRPFWKTTLPKDPGDITVKKTK